MAEQAEAATKKLVALALAAPHPLAAAAGLALGVVQRLQLQQEGQERDFPLEGRRHPVVALQPQREVDFPSVVVLLLLPLPLQPLGQPLLREEHPPLQPLGPRHRHHRLYPRLGHPLLETPRRLLRQRVDFPLVGQVVVEMPTRQRRPSLVDLATRLLLEPHLLRLPCLLERQRLLRLQEMPSLLLR